MNEAQALLICNKVLLNSGNNTISTFEDGTREANLCQANYEDIVTSLLDNVAFRWAQKYTALSNVATTSPSRFRYVYSKPSDLIAMRALVLPGWASIEGARVWRPTPVEYDSYADESTGATLYTCDFDSSAGVMGFYAFRVDEAEWPPAFRASVSLKLEQAINRGYERPREAASLGAEAEIQQQVAKTNASQQKSGQVAFKSRLVRARRSPEWNSGY